MRQFIARALLTCLSAPAVLAGCSSGGSGSGSNGSGTGGDGGTMSNGTNTGITTSAGGTQAGAAGDGGSASSGAGGGGGSDGGTTGVGGNGGASGTGGGGSAGTGGTSGTGGGGSAGTGGVSGTGGGGGAGTGGAGAGGAGTGGVTTATGGAGGSAGAGGSGGSAGSAAGGSGGSTSGTGGEAGETSTPIPEPRLTDLSITGTRVPLSPAFDAGTVRYVAYPTLPASELNVTAVAEEGLSITIAGSDAESGVPVSLPSLTPDNTFDVVVANTEGATQKYTVVYVPTSYPELRVTVRKAGASDDPIYISPLRGGSRYTIKLNNDGVPLYYARHPRSVYDFKKHSNGLLSYAMGEPGLGHSHIILDSDYQPIDKINMVGITNTDQHDFLILPSGNFVVMGLSPTERDLTPYGGPAASTVIDVVLQEITPAKDVVFEWNTWDYVSYDENLTPREEDYAHLNSVYVDTDGDWILSMRSTSQVMKIDRESGEVLWRLGGLSNEFTIEGDPFGGFCAQHAVSRLPSGNLLIYDNGNYCRRDLPARGNLTRVVEYAIDEESLEAELVWSYSREGFMADSQGSAQRLANGNTLIGWGNMANRSDVMLTEVTPAGEVVFEVAARLADDSIPVTYRARRFPE